MPNRYLLADLLQQAGPFSGSLLRKERQQALTDHLSCCVTVEALGGGVPGQDHSIECLADYGVVRRGDQGGKELLGLKTTALLNIKKLARHNQDHGRWTLSSSEAERAGLRDIRIKRDDYEL